uniref:Single stranded DNA binding protein 4 n=1 Tax=Callithrix jacchus TaxID=9483 RepID=A0A5F4WAW1_CALJA
MYAKGGKGSAVPSDSQAREKLALYVYEYLLHIGAQKSAQTFLSEIRWEKNITLGEPPGFLHSWCVFWDLYCAAPDRREACEHSGEAKAFQDYSAAAPSPVMGSLAPGDGMAAGPMAAGFFQGPPGSQPPPHNPNAPMMGPHSQVRSCRIPALGTPTLLPPSCPRWGVVQVQVPSLCPTPGHPSMGGPMQRVTPPRGMASIGPQSYGGGMRPPPNSLAGPGLPAMNMGPGVRGPWASPSGNSVSLRLGGQAWGGVGWEGTLPVPWSPPDSTNSSENMYTIMNPMGQGAGRANFPIGPGSEGPMAAMSAMEPHHVNGSLGEEFRADGGRPQSSPGAVAGLSNAPGTPRDDGEMAAAGTFLHPFPSESYSPGMTMSV